MSIKITQKQKKLRRSIVKRISKIEKILLPNLNNKLSEAEQKGKQLAQAQVGANIEILLKEADFLKRKLKELDSYIKEQFIKSIGG